MGFLPTWALNTLEQAASDASPDHIWIERPGEIEDPDDWGQGTAGDPTTILDADGYLIEDLTKIDEKIGRDEYVSNSNAVFRVPRATSAFLDAVDEQRLATLNAYVENGPELRAGGIGEERVRRAARIVGVRPRRLYFYVFIAWEGLPRPADEW